MHLSCSVRDFILSLLKHVWKTFTFHQGVRKKINNLNYLTVNALIELLNYTFYTAHEKDAIAPRFSNNSRMTVHIKGVQHEKSQRKRATWE